MNGFVGEFLILLGAFRWNPRFAAVAATGVILSAVYMLWMFQRVNYGEVTNDKNRTLPDLMPREWALMVPTIAMAIRDGRRARRLPAADGAVGQAHDRTRDRTELAASRFANRSSLSRNAASQHRHDVAAQRAALAPVERESDGAPRPRAASREPRSRPRARR